MENKNWTDSAVGGKQTRGRGFKPHWVLCLCGNWKVDCVKSTISNVMVNKKFIRKIYFAHHSKIH